MRKWKMDFFCSHFNLDVAEKSIQRIHMIFIQFFILCFMVQISVSILCGSLIYSHGLFGELRETVVVQDNRSDEQEVLSQSTQKKQKEKGCNVYNLWFLLLAVLVCICYEVYCVKTPPLETIVDLKVRINN